MSISIYLDFEYYNTAEEKLSVVCCAVLVIEKDKAPYTNVYWLDTDSYYHHIEEFRKFIGLAKEKNALLLSYNVIAEASALYSLGIDPLQFRWIDIMNEWKQLRNGNHKRLYGKYIDKGREKCSIPPVYPAPPVKDKGINNSHTGTNLLSCVYNLLDINLDADYKREMQQRILEGGYFCGDEIEEISEYALSDVQHLSAVMKIIAKENCQLAQISVSEYMNNAMVRGEWSARLAIIERTGIPVNILWLNRIAKNYKDIKNTICKNLVETVYPFFVWDKKKGWVLKKEKFIQFLTEQNLLDKWPKTEVGNYKTDTDTLEDFSEIKEIKELRRVKEMLGQIRSFNTVEGFTEVTSDEFVDSPNTEGLDTIFNRIGTDIRLRSWFNPYGTQTGRNAPPSRNFIFAMSAWLRSVVQPPPGYAITAIDYASQEFLIAACESGDQEMLRIYDSGDVYLGFAKRADPQRVPESATRKTHEFERDLFKATVLGMQYQMGIERLHGKIKRDLDLPTFPVEQAEILYDAHKETFHEYWDHVKSLEWEYRDRIPLKTRDGYYLYCDNPNPRSVANFPIQGAGGTLLRKAVALCQDAGLTIISPLHDALYFLHKIEDTEETIKLARKLMNDAFRFYYGRDIRMDAKTWKHGEIYVDKKGKKYFELLKQYFMSGDELREYEWNCLIDDLM